MLELVPEQLAAAITERLRIPTIGIGAGPGCSGQVQIITDILGLDTWQPKHAKPYVNLHETILEAVRAYAADVAAGDFPGPEQTVRMDDACSTRSSADRRSTRPPGGVAATCPPAGSRSTATSRSLSTPAIRQGQPAPAGPL